MALLCAPPRACMNGRPCTALERPRPRLRRRPPQAQVAEYRRQLGVRVSGFDAPRPIRSFAQCGFDPPLAQVGRAAGCGWHGVVWGVVASPGSELQRRLLAGC